MVQFPLSITPTVIVTRGKREANGTFRFPSLTSHFPRGPPMSCLTGIMGGFSRAACWGYARDGGRWGSQSQWTTFPLAAVPKQSPAGGSHHLPKWSQWPHLAKEHGWQFCSVWVPRQWAAPAMDKILHTAHLGGRESQQHRLSDEHSPHQWCSGNHKAYPTNLGTEPKHPTMMSAHRCAHKYERQTRKKVFTKYMLSYRLVF